MVIVAPIAATIAVLAAALPQAQATTSPALSTRIIASFDRDAGQTPEAMAVQPDGTVDLTFSEAAQVAQVTPAGHVTILAQLPTSGACPLFGVAITGGIVRTADGTLYVLACDGGPATGVWRISPGRAPVQIAQLPAVSTPNDMALDSRTGMLYIADSLLGVVWRVSTQGGAPSVWASGPALQRTTFAGANGIYVSGGAVWVSNTDQETILRIPILADGSAGPIQTAATGLVGVDDFTVVGPVILAALDSANKVVLVAPGGIAHVLLTAANGLNGPSDVKLAPGGFDVTSAAYFGGVPNLMAVKFRV